MMNSKYSLSSADWHSIFIGLIKALGGAALTYLSTVVGGYNWGTYTPLVVVVASALINIGWKVLDGKVGS